MSNEQMSEFPAQGNGHTLFCLTLNTFICQRKIQIMFKEKTTFKKCDNFGRGNAQKLAAKSTKILNNSAESWCQQTGMELQKTQPAHPVE